eukprot:g32422.t1
MHEWAYEVLELVDGDVDVHKFNNSSKTAEEDLHELFNQGKQQFEQLPSHNLHRDYTKHFLKGCFFRISLPTEGTDPKMEIDNWIGLVSQSIFAPNEKLVGKAAFERTLDIAFTTSLCRTFQHALTEFDADFINTVLGKAGVKSQQAVYFYELLLASAAQKNSQMNEKDMFPLGVEAKSVDKVRKLRSLPIPANKTIAITMDVKFQQQTSTKTEQPGIMSTLRNGDKSSQAGAEDKKLVGMELQDMRSDEGLLDEKEPCGPFVQVALNDFKENKWLLSSLVYKW